MGQTDIVMTKWMHFFPKVAHPYLILMRLDRPIGWWLLLLPGWFGILIASPVVTFSTIYLMGLFWVGAIVMRGAGCIINDLWDRDMDKCVARTASRPLASGTISIEDAAIFLMILLGIGCAILLQLPSVTILLGVLSLPLIVLYPFMKRITWWPQAFLGLTFNFGALMGGSAVTGDVTFAMGLVYIACIFWTLGYDTIYAHQDREDDLRVGIKSTALLFGENSALYVKLFYCVAAILFFIAAFVASIGITSIVLLCGAFIYGAYRLRYWQSESAASSLAVFKDQRDVGLLIILALAL